MRGFEVLFEGVITRFGLRAIEKSIENPHFIFCSVFQNLRLETIKLPGIRIALYYEVAHFVVALPGPSTKRFN